MDCFRTDFTSGRRAVPWKYLQAVTSRQDVTCRRCRRQGGRHVTSRHVTSGHHSAAVDKEAVRSRHVTSRQDVTGAAVDKEAVTSRHVRASQAPPWARMPSRHVRTSRGHVRMPGRHVTSRHDVRRPQSGPCSTQPKKLRSMRMCCKFSRTSTSPPHPTQEVTFFKNPIKTLARFSPRWLKLHRPFWPQTVHLCVCVQT